MYQSKVAHCLCLHLYFFLFKAVANERYGSSQVRPVLYFLTC